MPRQARLDIPGVLYHIRVRGINRSPVFKDEEGKTCFLQDLGNEVTKGQGSVYLGADGQQRPYPFQELQT